MYKIYQPQPMDRAGQADGQPKQLEYRKPEASTPQHAQPLFPAPILI
jgi:hypothetical protein